MKAGLRKIDVFSIVLGSIVGWSLLLAYLTMIPLNGTAFPLVIQKLFGDVLQFGYLYTIAGYRVYLGEIMTSSFIVVLFAMTISLIAPWFGREVILWIVDMASLGAAIAYMYVCLISYKKTEVRFRQILSILGVIISITFIGLLLIPGSPAALGKESLIALGAWIVIGGIFYKKVVD